MKSKKRKTKKASRINPSKAQPNSPEEVSASEMDTNQTPTNQSSAGNFLRNDQSLIMQNARSDRFTEKFRDGVVQRILDGHTTIAEARDKHYLTEKDVISWIKASFDRKQKKVDELTMQLQLIHGDDFNGNDGILKIENEPQRVKVEAEVIDTLVPTKLKGMKFIEMTGAQLDDVIDDGELHGEDLQAAGIVADSIIRINEQGDIEVRRPNRWDVIGGLMGNFEERVKKSTGFNWA